jgi:uncharacterized repeat protein (TIGR03943 family)
MSIRVLVRRWQGVALSLIGIVATLWLGLTGQLALYIHPRYFVFTIVMAAIAAVLVLAAFALGPAAQDGHGHEHADAGMGRWRWLWPAGSILTIAAAVVGLLVLPPSTLTTATVSQRGLNGSASVLTQNEAGKLAGGDYSAFTVRDWASLLRSGAGLDFFAGKTATVTGFVTPDKNDPANVFFVTRFVVTCCAVDAQPIGVPVYHPGWQNEYKTDSWVTTTSGFHANPDAAGGESIVLIPDVITPTAQPAQPYVY